MITCYKLRSKRVSTTKEFVCILSFHLYLNESDRNTFSGLTYVFTYNVCNILIGIDSNLEIEI